MTSYTQRTFLADRILAELKLFDDAVTTMGLHTSWVKTKLQNIGHGPPPQSVSVDGHLVEVTDKFVYWAALLTPLATPVLIFFDDSALHLQ